MSGLFFYKMRNNDRENTNAITLFTMHNHKWTNLTNEAMNIKAL